MFHLRKVHVVLIFYFITLYFLNIRMWSKEVSPKSFFYPCLSLFSKHQVRFLFVLEEMLEREKEEIWVWFTVLPLVIYNVLMSMLDWKIFQYLPLKQGTWVVLQKEHSRHILVQFLLFSNLITSISLSISPLLILSSKLILYLE